MQNKIRRPTFDGTRLVRGLWFDVALIGEDEARRRIFAHWSPGTRLHRDAGGYVLEFPELRLCRCADLDGAPLCEFNGVLSSAPLSKDERAQMPNGAVCLVRAAHPEVLQLSAAKRIDPAIWIDLRHIPVCEALRPPPAKHKVEIRTQADAKSVREILGAAIPKPSAEREAFLRDLEASMRGEKPGRLAGKGAGAGIVALGVLGMVMGWLGLLGQGGGGQGSGRGSGSGSGTAAKAARPKTLSPWARRLENALARLAMFTRVSKLMGWRHAAYMRRMLELFENGDLNEALRHAIPLGSGSDEVPRPTFGGLGPRNDLTVRAPNHLATSIGVDGMLDQHLRKLYRKTFERLDREGRIDEAVFILAELLKSGTEAVTYLERKSRFVQAAEMAETLELAPEIAVRLWWLAGDLERTMRLARRSNTFAEAVRLLEKSHAQEAAGMRKMWAQHLVEQGNLVEAAEVIWVLESERDKARIWLLQAEQAGGTLGVRALVRKLLLAPDSLMESETAINELLQAQGEDAAQQRERLALELLALPAQSTATTRLAAVLLRRVVVERSAGLNRLHKDDFSKLLAFTDASIMRSDMPALNFSAATTATPLATRTSVLSLQMDERGMQPIQDARSLPDGQYLLATGESGVLRIDRRGRVLAHYPVPAHQLVVSQNGKRALVLAQRDQTYRVARIDLLTAHVRDWISLPIRLWSHTYDGVTWSVVLENRLLALDCMQDHLLASWQIADLPGQIVGFAEDGARQVLLLKNHEGLEQWRYQLPARRLIQRDSVVIEPDVSYVIPCAGQERPLDIILIGERDDLSLIVRKRVHADEFRVSLGAQAQAPKVQTHGAWLSVLTQDAFTARCRVFDLRTGVQKADLALLQADHPQVSLYEQNVVLFDRAGRLIDIDCATGLARTMVVN